MQVEITLEDDRWQALEPICDIALEVVCVTLQLGDLSISVLGCDDARIAALNSEFRDEARTTNVLSWPAFFLEPGQKPPGPEIGDIAIAYDICAREARQQGKPFEHHVTHLVIHSILHLLGYDHDTDAQAAQMEAVETQLLAKLGLDDPYMERSA